MQLVRFGLRQQLERRDMIGSNESEVAAIEGGDPGESESLGRGDNRRVPGTDTWTE